MTTTAKRRVQRIASSFNAKARRLHVPGVVSWEMLAALPSQCEYCGISLDLDHGTWDHEIPFDKGGVNWVYNIVRCCTSCNRAKHTKSRAEYLEHRSMTVVCKRPGCGRSYKPRWAEWQRGMARYCSHQCAGMAKGQEW